MKSFQKKKKKKKKKNAIGTVIPRSLPIIVESVSICRFVSSQDSMCNDICRMKVRIREPRNFSIYIYIYFESDKKKYENSIFASSCYIYTSWTKKSSELKKKLYFNLSILWQETN